MSVLEKIRKLRAVADRSSNKHEVYAAMLAAQRLMAEHDLQEADLAHDGSEAESPHGPVEHASVDASGRYTAWKGWLGMAIADNFRCACYTHRDYDLGRSRTQIMLLGRRDDVAVAREVYLASQDAALRLADAHLAVRRSNAQGWKRYSIAHWRHVRTSFYSGFVDGLRDQFTAQRATHQEWGLVLVKDAMVVSEAERVITGKPFVSRARNGRDQGAYGAGYAAGRHMETAAGSKRLIP